MIKRLRENKLLQEIRDTNDDWGKEIQIIRTEDGYELHTVATKVWGVPGALINMRGYPAGDERTYQLGLNREKPSGGDNQQDWRYRQR